MNSTQRIVTNTLAQHIRSVINICLSLYSTRLVLQALGESDFGIYSLVASVVALLGFLTNAMVITTQRQLSFCYGKGDISEVRTMFSNSLLLHIVCGVILCIILAALEPLLFSGFLNIEESRTDAAITVYYLVILTLLLTFLTAPYRALFISRENIVYISIVDVLDGIIKLAAAIWLLSCPFDRLISYAFIIIGIMAFNLVALAGWAQQHFKESLLFPRKKDISFQAMKELTGFAGWTIYSTGCIIGRNQGISLILNRFFGSIVNASYGISQQVFGSIMFVAVSVTNAISPQLIKAEGSGDRKRMLWLSEILSKYSVLLLSLICIPLVFEMPRILQIWLGKVPDYAVLLCRFTLVAALCDQVTMGLGTANQAIGRIRNYSLVINSIKLFTLPFFYMILALSGNMIAALSCYLLFEIICALARLPFLKVTAGLSITHFCTNVILRTLPALALQVTACWFVTATINSPYRFLLTTIASFLIGSIAIWFTALAATERATAIQLFHKHVTK